jgi:hypothetical protein
MAKTNQLLIVSFGILVGRVSGLSICSLISDKADNYLANIQIFKILIAIEKLST